MATPKKGKEATKEAPAKKVREKKAPKDSYLKDNYVVINPESFNGVRTSVQHIRGVGSIVREEAINKDGIVTAISSIFIPGVKVKTKKDFKYLIVDKGPKSKKGKAGAEDEEDESED